MQFPIGNELINTFDELGLPNDHIDIAIGIHTSSGGTRLRNHLLWEEANSSPRRITDASFWDTSRKYQFDIVALDIATIADSMAFSLALSHIYMPFVGNPVAKPLLIIDGGKLFWYHLDAGFRLASSGWDRIAILIDLAFDLQLEEQTKLIKVLKELPKKQNGIVHNPHFKWMKKFRENAFSTLEGYPLGVRHETTHRVSISTRFMNEYLEQIGDFKAVQRHTAHDWHGTLMEQYNYYIEGIGEVVALLDSAPIYARSS